MFFQVALAILPRSANPPHPPFSNLRCSACSLSYLWPSNLSYFVLKPVCVWLSLHISSTRVEISFIPSTILSTIIWQYLACKCIIIQWRSVAFCRQEPAPPGSQDGEVFGSS
jgi:hypothetical protein